jgi:hypothetical protein
MFSALLPLQINTTVTVALYNSTTVFDDLAWGAVWLYRATGTGTNCETPATLLL